MQTKEIVDFLQEYKATGYVISGCLNRNSLRNVRERAEWNICKTKQKRRCNK